MGANRYAVVEAIRGNDGWNTFEEKVIKAVLIYEVKLEKMNACK